MAEALFQIARAGRDAGEGRLPDARRRDRSRDHELAGRDRRRGASRRACADEQGTRDRAVGRSLRGRRRASSSARTRAIGWPPDFPRDTIASVKRFMGRGPRDAEATRKLTPYRFARRRPRQHRTRASCASRSRAAARSRRWRCRRRSCEVLKRARRGGAGRAARGRGDHRAGVLRRRPAPGDARRGPAGGARGAAPAQRADRGGAGVRPRQAGGGDVRGVRSGRRHVRHLDPEAGGAACSR